METSLRARLAEKTDSSTKEKLFHICETAALHLPGLKQILTEVSGDVEKLKKEEAFLALGKSMTEFIDKSGVSAVQAVKDAWDASRSFLDSGLEDEMLELLTEFFQKALLLLAEILNTPPAERKPVPVLLSILSSMKERGIGVSLGLKMV